MWTVAPSSISQQISALQRHSPALLTFRDGRRTAVTDAGRALALAAIDVEVALERAGQAVTRFQSERSGTVSVAAFHSGGLAVFGPLIAALNSPDQPRVSLTDFDVAQESFPLAHAITVITGIGGSEVRIAHRINDFLVAAGVVAASGCIALMPRYTTDLHDHPDLVLRPLAHPGLGRYIDYLSRPETRERANVKTVLSAIKAIAVNLTLRPDVG